MSPRDTFRGILERSPYLAAGVPAFAASLEGAGAAPASWREVPAKTDESDALSKALQKRGFTFVGSTICYAFMQSVGMVNDHLADCPARNAVPFGASGGEAGRQASF